MVLSRLLPPSLRGNVLALQLQRQPRHMKMVCTEMMKDTFMSILMAPVRIMAVPALGQVMAFGGQTIIL